MCRLFGMSSHDHPVTARFWLLDAPDSLEVQSRREPDGSGLGWYDERATPRVQRDAVPAWRDPRFAQVANEVTSRRFIAHLRYASTGAVDPRNTHPFEQDARLFAHNGVVEDLELLRAELGTERLRDVHGETDSELTFALVTREIERCDGDVAEGIRAAGEWLAANVPVYAWNIVLTTSDELHALRWPETHELWFLDRTAGGCDAPRAPTHFDGAGRRAPLAVSSHDLERHPALIVASEPLDDDPGWRLLGSGELVSADRDGVVSTRQVLVADPDRILTLEQLDAQAAASQVAPTSG